MHIYETKDLRFQQNLKLNKRDKKVEEKQKKFGIYHRLHFHLYFILYVIEECQQVEYYTSILKGLKELFKFALNFIMAMIYLRNIVGNLYYAIKYIN